jgi:hypothetical protein
MFVVEVFILRQKSNAVLVLPALDGSKHRLPSLSRETFLPNQGCLQSLLPLFVVFHVLERMTHVRLLEKAGW